MSLQEFNQNGLELVVNISTGESFATISGYARMAGKAKSTISERTHKPAFGQGIVKVSQIQTPSGSKTVRLLTEDWIADNIVDDNPQLAKQMLKAGIRLYLHGAAGFQYQVKSALRKKSLTPAVKAVFPLLTEDFLLPKKNSKGLHLLL